MPSASTASTASSRESWRDRASSDSPVPLASLENSLSFPDERQYRKHVLYIRPLVFVEELLMHLLSPFSIPFIWAIYGRQTVHNKNFSGMWRYLPACKPRYLLVHLIEYYFVNAVNVSAAALQGVWEKYWAEIVVMNALFLFRIIITALRHSLLPDSHRQVIRHGTRKEAIEAQRRTQLFTGVNLFDSTTTAELLQGAADDHGFDLTQKFLEKDPSHGLVQGPSCMEFGRAVIANVRHHRKIDERLLEPWKNRVLLLTWLFAMLLALLPLITRCREFGLGGWADRYARAPTFFAEVLICLVIWWEAFVLGMFLHTAVKYCYGSALFMDEMSLSIFPAHRRGSLGKFASGTSIVSRCSEDFDRSLVDVMVEDNALLWFEMRKVFLNFAYAFQFRLNIYVGLCCLLSIGLVGWIAGRVLAPGAVGPTCSSAPTGVSTSSFAGVTDPESDACRQLSQQEWYLELFCLIYTLFVFANVSLLIYFGDQVNWSHMVHRGILTERLLELRRRRAKRARAHVGRSRVSAAALGAKPKGEVKRAFSSAAAAVESTGSTSVTAAAAAGAEGGATSMMLDGANNPNDADTDCGAADAVLYGVIKGLEVQSELNPVSVLGCRASVLLLQSFLVGLLTTVGFAVRLLEAQQQKGGGPSAAGDVGASS